MTELTKMFLMLAHVHGIGPEVAAKLPGAKVPNVPEVGLADLLRRRRAELGWTMHTIRDRSGISNSSLRSYEAGEMTTPGVRTIQALAYSYRLPFIHVVLASMRDSGFTPKYDENEG